MPAVAKVEVLDPASLPSGPIAPNRGVIVAIGLLAGLIVGLIATAFRRRPKAAWRMAAFAAAGCAGGVAVAFLLPFTYISSAVMRISLPVVPDTPTGIASAHPAVESLLPIQREILSPRNLAALIQRPSLNLYPNLRAHKPLEEAIEKMRKDLRITPVGDSAFRISYAYPDDVKAQLVVRAIITQFVELNVTAMRGRAQNSKEDDALLKIQALRAGVNLEVLDPASLPERPAAPNRTVVSALGATLGLLLGALSLMLSARSRRPPSPESC
jgi:uncharacterized protein involved in exopolysaccharide biosynthesis